MRLANIFYGRVQVVYSWGRYGWTRGGGKTWHGGIDLVGLDDKTIRMPYYKGKKITGKVVRARIVLDHSNKTWEWGYYVCVQLDADQTPDAVNFLYFCHCSSLLVQAGQRVSSGDAGCYGENWQRGTGGLPLRPLPSGSPCHGDRQGA